MSYEKMATLPWGTRCRLSKVRAVEVRIMHECGHHIVAVHLGPAAVLLSPPIEDWTTAENLRDDVGAMVDAGGHLKPEVHPGPAKAGHGSLEQLKVALCSTASDPIKGTIGERMRLALIAEGPCTSPQLAGRIGAKVSLVEEMLETFHCDGTVSCVGYGCAGAVVWQWIGPR